MDAREFTKKRRKGGTAASAVKPSSPNAPNAREFTKQRRERGAHILYTTPEQRTPTPDEQRNRNRQNLAYRAKVRAYEEAYTDYLNTPKYASPKLEENAGAKQGGSAALSIPITPGESAMLWQNDKRDGTTTLTDSFANRKYVRMMGYDLDAAKARLGELDGQIKSGEVNIPKDPTDYAGTEFGIIKTRERKEKEEERQRLQKEIDEVEAYRKAVHYAGLPDNADFEEKSARGSGAASDAVYFDYSSRADELDRKHRAEYDALLRDYGEEEANKYLYTQFGAPTNAYKQDFLEELTDDERKTFNYLLNTEGEKSAEEFLRFMQGNLNARAAYRDYANAKHDGFMGGAADILNAFSFGVGQAVSGVKNIFNDEADDISYAEVKNALTREGRVARAETDAGKWIAGASYDLAATAGNMLPSIAIGMVNPTAGTIAFSTSAGGNYKQEALRAGYTAEQATRYGVLAGAAEGALQTVLGGIVHVGGGAVGNLASQGMTKISNVLAKCSVNGEIALRLGAKYLGNMAGEFSDEYLQEILNPVFRNICLDENNQFKPFTEEALYAGILGALNAGLLNITAISGMYAESREETNAKKFRYYIGGVKSPDAVGEISMPGAPDASAEATSAEQIVTILEDSGVDAETAEKMAPDLQTTISEIKAKEAAAAADISSDVATGEGNAQEPQTNTTDALREAAREMLAEEAAKADMGRKLVTMDKWYEQPQTETAVQQPAALPAAPQSVVPEATEATVKRSGPATVTKYEGFNSRRYSDPWVALVGKNGRLDFSQKIGGYTGGYRTGEAGELYITNPQANQIYAYGQKDYRGNNGGYQYVQYKNGEFVEVKKDELTEKLAEMQETSPQTVAQSRTDAVRESAATLGKTGERVLNEMYNPETNARDYVYGMTAYYNAGKNGTPIEQVNPAPVLTAPMREAAYLAGQMDAGAAQSASGGEVQPSAAVENIPLAKQDTAAYNGSIKEKTLASVAEHLASNTEDIGHGTESVEEVSDGGRVQQSDAGGKDAGEVLGGVPAGDVRRDEGGRNAVQAPVVERQPDIRDAGADGVAGDAGVGSAGVRERGTVQPAAGEDSVNGEDASKDPNGLTEDEVAALLAYKSGGSYQLNAKLRDGTALSETEQQTVENLDSALQKLRPHKGVVYRNIGFDSVGGKAARVREAQIIEQLNPSREPEPEMFDDDGDDVEMRRDASAGGDTKAAMASDSREAQWQADRVGEDKQPMRLDELIEKIRHDFEVNITKGHVRGKGVMGQYNTRDEGIRVRNANDLPTALHELGHHLDNNCKILKNAPKDAMKELVDNFGEDNKSAYPKSEWGREGFAEYVRKFMQNRETAAIDYPVFTKHFLSSFSGNDLAKIEQLADEVNAYYADDADSAASSIRLREEKMPDARTFGEKIKAKSDALYQAWVDSLNGIKRFDRATGANTYILASNSAYADAVAGNILIGDLTDANGQYVAPGLTTALQGVNVKNKEEYRAFGEYLVVRHGPERLKEGMRVFADDRKNSTAFMNRRETELAAKYPAFEAAADRLYEFQRQFLDTWGVDTGLISEETAQSWAARWQYYVPFNRAVGDKAGIGAKRGFANQNSTIKRAHGSGLDVLHPVDSIINNIVRMVTAGIRNNVMREITDAAQKHGANAEWMERVPTPMRANKVDISGLKDRVRAAFSASDIGDAGIDEAFDIIGQLDDILVQYRRGKAFGNVMTVLKDGKPEFWKINDPLLLESLTNLAPLRAKGFWNTLASINRFTTNNITGLNLIWSLKSNSPRDAMTMLYYTNYTNGLSGKAADIKTLLSGIGTVYVSALKKSGVDALYKEYLAMGGGRESAYSADLNLQKKYRTMLAKKLSGNRFSHDVYNPVEWIEFLSNMVEAGPRFATYKLMRTRHGMTPQEAFYAATDITVNFRRGGTEARVLNRFVPFLNAGIQSIDKHIRHLTASDAPPQYRNKVVRSRVMTLLAMCAITAAIISIVNMADEEKREDYYQLSNFTKNNYFCIPLGDGKYFAIPKAREISFFSTLFETIIESASGNDHAFDSFYDYAVDTWLPNFASDLAKADPAGAIGSIGVIGTAYYVTANRDFLGRPIESTGLGYLLPKDRYNERTSKIAYWVGQAFNISPQKLDFLGESIMGGFWKSQRALFPVGGESVDYTLGVYNTYIKDNQYSTDLTNWLYDKAEKSSQTSKSDPKNLDKKIVAKTDDCMREFYGNYNKLAKNLASSPATRGTRQTVLSMINEYRKASDSGAQTDAQKAVYAVCAAVGDTSLLPAVMPVVVRDGQKGDHELGAVQYVEYQLEYNRFYWEYAEDVLGGLTDDADKIRALKSAKTIAKERATSNVLARIGAPKTKFDEKYGDIQGITDVDIVKFRAEIDLANDDGGLTQEEVEDILDDMKVSKEAKQKLWQAANSKWSEWNNPYR